VITAQPERGGAQRPHASILEQSEVLPVLDEQSFTAAKGEACQVVLGMPDVDGSDPAFVTDVHLALQGVTDHDCIGAHRAQPLLYFFQGEVVLEVAPVPGRSGGAGLQERLPRHRHRGEVRRAIAGADDAIDVLERHLMVGKTRMQSTVHERHVVDDLHDILRCQPAAEQGAVVEQLVLPLAEDSRDMEVLLLGRLEVALQVLDLMIADDEVHRATGLPGGLLELVGRPEHLGCGGASVDEVTHQHQVSRSERPMERLIGNAMGDQELPEGPETALDI